MTKKSNNTSPFRHEPRRSPRKRPREAINVDTADGEDERRRLDPGPGRSQKLDPDQATLNQNLRLLRTLASIQSPLKEAAAQLGVSSDTLRDFFHRYPEARQMWDDCQLNGLTSVRSQLFKNMSGDSRNRPDPETARWMGERFLGFVDPLKARELDLRERDVARQEEESKQRIELQKQELDQRERAVVARERELALKQEQHLGSGAPIDIKSLSLPQLMQLLERLRAGMQEAQGSC